jgi:arsenate reductase-like glutaredoxin family protein
VVGETVLAAKTKLGPKEALALAKSVARVIAAKGRKVTTFDLKTDKPTDADLLAVLLGPTGNLRAPTAVVGDTLLVGFNPDAYRGVLHS